MLCLVLSLRFLPMEDLETLFQAFPSLREVPQWYWAQAVRNQALVRHAGRGDLPSVRALLRAGATSTDWALVQACGRGHVQIAKTLTEAGADPNFFDGEPLRTACFTEQVDVIRWLLTKGGADVHAKDDDALRGSCLLGCEVAVQLLLAAGADPTACKAEAIHSAYYAGHRKILHMLLSSL